MEELWKAKQKVLELKANLEKKSALYKSYRDLCEKEKQLLESIKKEQRDVDALHGFSLTSFFETVKRNKSNREKKEIEELSQVKMAYDCLLIDKEALRQTLEKLEGQCAEEEEVIHAYDLKFNEVLSQCTLSTHSYDEKLLNYKNKLEALAECHKKCLEAHALNQKVQDALSDLTLTLQDAIAYSSLEVTGGDIWAKTLKEERFSAFKEKNKASNPCLEHYNNLIEALSERGWIRATNNSFFLVPIKFHHDSSAHHMPLHSELLEILENIKLISNRCHTQEEMLVKCKEVTLKEIDQQKTQVENFIFQMPLSS